MTLSRQLILLVCLLFFLVFAGTFFISLQNTRDYLENQLDSHAQDTATSLGLSLKPHLEKNDIAIMDSMVDAIFDRGYYTLISLEKMDGSIIVKSSQPVKIEGVPEWFVNLIPLNAPFRSSVITMGWNPGAKVIVQSNPGYAYDDLWDSAAGMLRWSLGSLLAAIIIVIVALRFILSPLRDIAKQALAIASREFPILEKLPRTRDLRVVVLAMNKMASKVENMLAEQTELAEKMRREAYDDPVTGLINRRGFNLNLDRMVTAKEEVPYGAMFIVQIADFDDYNKKNGYAAGDELLKQVTQLLADLVEPSREPVLARISGSEFAVLIGNLSVEEAQEIGESISRGLGKVNLGQTDDITLHIGVGYYRAKLSAADLLAGADMALRSAQRSGETSCCLSDTGVAGSVQVRGATQIKEMIQNAIDAHGFVFYFQPVKMLADGQVLHYELLARIKDENGDLIPAGVFIPTAERFGITTEIDRILVEQVLEMIAASPDSSNTFALNLSATSVLNQEFVDWLCDKIEASSSVAHRIMFEMTETGALIDLERVSTLVERLREHGVSFGLDHFGARHASFGYLKSLKLDYIKIDGSYVVNIGDEKENQFFVGAISKIAHGLEMKVIAEMVESESDFNTLAGLNIDAAQGYYLGKPGESLDV